MIEVRVDETTRLLESVLVLAMAHRGGRDFPADAALILHARFCREMTGSDEQKPAQGVAGF